MFETIISSIKPLDIEAMEKCQLRLDNLTKPLGSLHSFEKIARQMAGITGSHRPKTLQKCLIIMKTTDDHCSPDIGIQVFAEHVSAELIVVDMNNEINASGRENSIAGREITKEEVERAIAIGIKIGQEQVKKGCRVIGLGLLGTKSVMPSASIVTYFSEKQPNPNDSIEVLRTMGNTELAGLVGVILGAALERAAVVLDGLGTSAAALLAVQMAPQVRDYLVASHFAVEEAHRKALELLSLPGYLHLGIQSEEGIGAVLGMSLINASLHVINDMKTFGEAKVAVAQDGPGALKQCINVTD